MKAKVSITLLTYNHERYISDALDGILNQTYDLIELIILDDASTDSTVSIIESYIPRLEKKCVKVIFIRHENNTGNISANCNEMMRLATGKYIKDYAGDDILLPDCIEILVGEMEKHQDVDVIHANCFVEDDNYHYGDEYSWILFFNRGGDCYEKESLFLDELICNQICAPTSMLRSSNFIKYGFFDETLKYEDYEMWLRIIKNGGKFYYCNKIVVVYRRSTGAITNFEVDGERKLLNLIKIDYQIKNKYIECLDDSDKMLVYKSFYQRAMKEIRKMHSNEGLEMLEKLLPEKILEYVKNPSECMNKKDINSMAIENRKTEQELIILNKWLKEYIKVKNIIKQYENKKVAIYGFGRIGNNLLTQMEEWGQPPIYIIDRRADEIYCNLPIYKPTDCLPKVDVVISTVISGFNGVKDMLELHLDAECINLMNLIYFGKKNGTN